MRVQKISMPGNSLKNGATQLLMLALTIITVESGSAITSRSFCSPLGRKRLW